MKAAHAVEEGVADGTSGGPPEDWVTRSRGHPDLLLVLAGVALVVLGAVTTVQEHGHALAAGAETAGFDPAGSPADVDYRTTHVSAALGLVTAVSALALWRLVWARRSARLSRHARRPVLLLLVGCGLLDLAYYADTTFGLTAAHAARGLLVTPLYAIAGVLVTGAAWRIRSLIRPLPPGDPETA